MKIYTKTGDRGETGLFGGGRVPKDHHRIRTYGTLDELNSVLGWAVSESSSLSAEFRERLLRLQNELFQLGAELATPRDLGEQNERKPSISLIGESHVTVMEKEIDAMEAQLTPLRNFILPGGSKASALLHFARTVARRAEREIITLHRAEPLRDEILHYMNRISDYLFVCARFANFEAKVADIPWKPSR